ncbi:MAG: ATPase domain-containing protein [Pirellulales bacterium]
MRSKYDAQFRRKHDYARLATGVPGLDELLGGGLIPGTLTVVVGATGIGKTQLGLQFAEAGRAQESYPGIVFDMTSRGDPQSHAEYVARMFDRTLQSVDPEVTPSLVDFFAADRRYGDYLNIFRYAGRRVARGDLSFEEYQEWQAELARKLITAIAFFYGNFARGCRRTVIDGIEPLDRKRESIQLELFEYVYQQILRKDPEWVARDLFREHFREMLPQINTVKYDPRSIGCMLLYTSAEPMLHQLLERPLDEGDLLANANTIIYMGKVHTPDGRVGRALHVAKHRGSACSDEIRQYAIDDRGVRML